MVGKEAEISVPRKAEIEPFVSAGNKEVVVFPGVLFHSRQKEVLTLTAQGLSRRQIAEELSLHINSIKYHIRHIKDAFGTDSMFQSIIKAVNIGILDVSELTKDLDKQAMKKLSTRELQILESLSSGRNQKETAEILFLHSASLRRNLRFIRRKLGLKKNPQEGLTNLPSILLYMDAKNRNALPPKEYSDLTDKEKGIFKLIALGYSGKQISEILNATTNSVYLIYTQIFKSFDVSGLTELLIKLVDKKIIDPHKYIEGVKKADSNFLKNVDSADISSLLSVISSDEWVFLNAFVTGNKKGTTNKEIADVLNVSTVTIHGSILSISKKLGGAKREHIAMWYLAATNAEGE